ncbi:thiamine ABC transporter substrate-binding protein [Nocardioides dongxiaopingii]|uniref:thiamine ABC transporter substrate-binding protein n=1 Tax=Nocardioides TaxID=1839 RepID=UPI0010C7633E|nr:MULTISPECIES: thiamine ABC transporter substrate-binding protein [Nocardioides]QCW49657.1 thiamine ABC transporter substrate-binding protein [Nocardioides sp. S-1144]
MRCAIKRVRTTAVLATAVLATASCSLVGGDDDGGGTDADGNPTEVVLLTHGSFSLPDDLVAAFEEESGLELVIRTGGDAGEVTNRLVLTKDDPAGDVVFGIDNAFGSRALDEGVLAPADVAWPAGAEQFALPGDDDRLLTPVDNGNVCVNIDTTYFAEKGLAEPETLEDLTEPAYRDLFVTPSAATSSPGLAFLLATIAEYGEEWPAYWERLMGNGAEIASGWTDAYQVAFTQGGGDGDRPIVTSYDSSPAFTVPEDGTASTTRALLDTCFLQVEYAGVLAGAANPDGAAQVVEWLVTPEVQAALPDNMYVFPVADGVALPEAWATLAERPADPAEVDPAEVAAERDAWLEEWTEITTR